MMYAEGHHLPQDTELALHWLERAAKQGHLDAQLDLGLLCLESGDAEGGRQWLIIAGAGGSAQAQYQLFRYYFEGQYGAPDYSQAMEWLEWAVQGGVVEAQDALGSLYLYGENVPEDRKKARYWLRKAAAKSLPQAQYYLGLLYLSEPAPTTRQRNSGLQWLSKAARANFAQAQFMLGVYLLQGKPAKRILSRRAFGWNRRPCGALPTQRNICRNGKHRLRQKRLNNYGIGIIDRFKWMEYGNPHQTANVARAFIANIRNANIRLRHCQKKPPNVGGFFGAGWETGLHGWQSPSGGAGNPSLFLRGLQG